MYLPVKIDYFVVGRDSDIEGAGVGHAHRGVIRGDINYLKGTVAAEEQPRMIVACVAGETEPRQMAPAGAQAEGVGQTLTSPQVGVTVRQPNLLQSHIRICWC